MAEDNLQDVKQYGDDFISNYRKAKIFSKISITCSDNLFYHPDPIKYLSP